MLTASNDEASLVINIRSYAVNVQKFSQEIENIQQRLSDCQGVISKLCSQPITPEITAVVTTTLTELKTLTAELQQQLASSLLAVGIAHPTLAVSQNQQQHITEIEHQNTASFLTLDNITHSFTPKYHQQLELELLQRENYLAALVEVQRLLLIYPDCKDCYSQILEILGTIAGASRIYLFENYWDTANCLLMSQRAEWCAEGILPEIDNPNLQNLSYNEFFPRWAEALKEGKIIAGIVAEFPDSERLILEPQGILSILIFPD